MMTFDHQVFLEGQTQWDTLAFPGDWYSRYSSRQN